MTQSTKRIRRIRSAPEAARVVAFSTTRQRADISRQVDPDYTQGMGGGVVPISPLYDPAKISAVYEKANMLGQCVEAYVTNIGRVGFDIVAVSEDTEIDEDERRELQSFIDHPNSDDSLSAVLSLLVEDREKFGYAFLEVIRDAKGAVTILRHAKSVSMGICPRSEETVEVRYDVARGKRTAMVRELKRFRRYVQIAGGKLTYFKEMGDPRKMDYRTGQYASPANPVAPENEATELIHYRRASDDAYGVPRWIQQLPSILGSREAEEVNLRYFEDNMVPSMILSVAGGRLTGESFREMSRVLKNSALGKERQNQIILLEAVPEKESLDDKGNVSLRIDKLTDARPSDGLFKDYDEANQAKVRSAFRLPPVAVGMSQDVTFATANVSAFIAETQVYLPERMYYDEIINNRLVNNARGLNLKTVKLRSKSPVITNPETLIKSLTALNVMGAVTPRTALAAANKILQIEMPQYPEKGEEGYEDWMDRPIIFATAKGSGNEGIDPAKSGATHEGQAVKDEATKALEAEGDVSPSSPENGSQ